MVNLTKEKDGQSPVDHGQFSSKRWMHAMTQCLHGRCEQQPVAGQEIDEIKENGGQPSHALKG